jgi:hypothetical protein
MIFSLFTKWVLKKLKDVADTSVSSNSAKFFALIAIKSPLAPNLLPAKGLSGLTITVGEQLSSVRGHSSTNETIRSLAFSFTFQLTGCQILDSTVDHNRLAGSQILKVTGLERHYQLLFG